MDDLLKKWAESLITRHPYEIYQKYNIKGINKRHVGAHLEYAIIEFQVEPYSEFCLEIPEKYKFLTNEEYDYLLSGIYGFLDIVLVSFSNPIKNIKITISNIEIHPVESSIAAFRVAGRNAGKELLEQLRKYVKKI